MKPIAILLTLTFIIALLPVRAGIPTTGPAAQSAGTGIRVLLMRGGVSVRHGASEQWVKVFPGDILKPDDSMQLGEGASATLNAGGEKIELPAMVIVDIADLRDITRADLLLKLAMEDVRSVPRPDPKLGNPGIPKTTTTRAGNRDGRVSRSTEPGQVNTLRLGGTKVLHDNGYYGTCVLRSREIFRVEPALAGRIDARLRVADALEKMNLREEAYNAYAALASENLSAAEKRLVEEKLEALKK